MEGFTEEERKNLDRGMIHFNRPKSLVPWTIRKNYDSGSSSLGDTTMNDHVPLMAEGIVIYTPMPLASLDE